MYAALQVTTGPPTTQTITVEKLVTAPAPESEDDLYSSRLAEKGIGDRGVEATMHIFRGYGHQICYALAPPAPQQYDAVVNATLAAQVELRKVAGYDIPTFTHEDASNMVNVALDTYCPNLRPIP
ncbi:hypothetical protein ABW16_13740 [Mycolicibacter heraklionensis]|uniref:DUF732 domain-containing protein n=2 Tax=Mycolicibacter heraklionensis TaxID=512402 RepID=A0ABR5FEI5_9MYCO|nr:hypothetical protein ABW16_13740 [Mycolicibacter heraklionensis]